jgi:hypothetical protein
MIRCSSCGTELCYVCRQKIRNYNHFCVTPHCNHSSCGMCARDSDTQEDDERTMRKAEREVAMEGICIIKNCLNPFCRRPVFKSSDANRVQCRCGIYYCSACRRRIGGRWRTGVKHFCCTVGCTHDHCGKCPNYSTSQEQKGREERQGRFKTTKAAAKVRRWLAFRKC